MAYEALKVGADLDERFNPFSDRDLWARFGANKAKARAKEAAERGDTAASDDAWERAGKYAHLLPHVAAALGDTKSQPRASAAPLGATASRPRLSTGVASYSQADVDKAAMKARAEERARITAVYAHEASKGRERLAAALLAAPEGWTVAQITAHLPGVAASLAAKRTEAGVAVWDRVNAKAEAQRLARGGR